MEQVAVVLPPDQLVGPPESDQIRRNRPQSRRDQDWDHLAIEVRPSRLAVEKEARLRGGRALVNIVDSEPSDGDVLRRKRIPGQAGKPLIGRAKEIHEWP